MALRLSIKGSAAFAMMLGFMAAFDAGAAKAQSSAYCDSYARDNASHYQRGTGILGGAAIGALGGAAIGGIVDGGKGAGRGAAIGALGGALGGAIRDSSEARAAYNRAYRDCMARNTRPRAPAARPAPVADRGGPEPWTPAWYRYCADKYRSFNPETGKYLTYSGRYRLCR